jgi:hypothetical protein
MGLSECPWRAKLSSSLDQSLATFFVSDTTEPPSNPLTFSGG